MDIMGYAKSHPWTTGAVVIGGGLVFILISGVFSGGGESSGDGSSSKPTDAEIAANAQIAAAQIAAQAAASQAGAQLQAAQIGAGVQMNSDGLAAQVAMRNLEIQRDLGLADTEAGRQVNLASIDAQKGLGIAQIQGQVQTQQIIANASTSQAKAASKSSSLGSILGFAGAALSFFSDDRLKENIQFVGRSENGYGIYEFNYKGSTRRHRGVIAQDVAKYRPDAVFENSNGYMMVNPVALEYANA